jgi:lysophospholipase L1-like esterase
VKNWIKKSLAIALSVAFACMLAEVGLRAFFPQPTGPVQFAYDPVRGAIPTPGQRGRRVIPGVFSYQFTNNSLGLRGPEIGPKTQRRILLLGDSFTYGFGVDDDQTFAYRLEKLTGDEVINAGNGGTGTDYALRFYESVGKFLKPDLVVLCFFPNDFQDNERGTYYNADLTPRDLSDTVIARKNLLNNAVCNWLLTHSQVANLIKVDLIHTGLWQISGPVDETHINVEPTKRYLTALENSVRQSNSTFIVVYIPSDSDVESFRHGQKSLSEAAFQSIYPAYSLTESMAASGYGIGQLYFPAERHWTPLAHKIATEALAPLVTDERARARDLAHNGYLSKD